MDQPDNTRGLVTQPRERGLTPAIAAEQQRAKAEIEAALTIAWARPRDEAVCLERILIACQRTGVAESAAYQYAKGGTNICGPTIRLLEVIAQKWGNIWFGFRELHREEGRAGLPGESLVEAMAWDLESNIRRQVQFSVQHAERTKKGLRVITDPREVYEWIANQAQRRVRTCLENVIPRDIVDEAMRECDKTLEATLKITDDLIARMLDAFAALGVSRSAIEKRIQRKVDKITPAQVLSLRKIRDSINDGIANPDEFFELDAAAVAGEKPKTATERATDALEGKKKAPKTKAPKPEVTPEAKTEAPEATAAPQPASQGEAALFANLKSEMMAAVQISDQEAKFKAVEAVGAKAADALENGMILKNEYDLLALMLRTKPAAESSGKMF